MATATRGGLGLLLGAACWSASGMAAAGGAIPGPRIPGVIVFDGDSVSAGFAVPPADAPDRQLARLLRHPARFSNVAVPGAPVSGSLDRFPTRVAPLYDPAAPFNLIAFHAGDNDIAAGRTAEEAYADLTRYVALAHRQGWKIIVSTELARPEWPPEQQSRLAAYTVLETRNGAGADMVIPYASAPGMADPAGREGSPFFSPDQVHPSARGYGVLAQMLQDAIERLHPNP